ncbi:MAG: VWA domain-containing protein [Chloroflexi bacterium]|nr:VWA domain-containing protein [Chloroflexota bacterium]MBP8057871.1 VWA domain-containing protein [Chloroflexota bacterium]
MEKALNITVQATTNKLGALNVSQLLYLLVNVQPPPEYQKARTTLNICLVIDRSTSMRGERLDQVKAAAALILEKLTAEDTLSVITFSDRAEVVVPNGPVTNRTMLMARVQGIQASGGTEIYQGLAMGMQELAKYLGRQGLSHLVLLTDGHTYGDAGQCIELSQRAASRNIGISALGIGTEWNDQFLDALVAPSGGQSAYIEDPNRILELLQERVKGLGAAYAHNVRLIPRFPEGVQVVSAFKTAPYAQPLSANSKGISLGALEGGYTLSILLELNVPPFPVGTTVQLPLGIIADIPQYQLQNHEISSVYTLHVVQGQPLVDPPVALVEAVQVLNLYRMSEKAWQEIETGHLDKATKRMERLTTRLFEAGYAQLAQNARTETDLLQKQGKLSVEGRKKLKYGTRALMTQKSTRTEE